jgi:DNA modification methylase
MTTVPGWDVHEGDCVDVMRGMPEASVDAVVCDPPYGLEFMGKDWDSLGGRQRAYKARDEGHGNTGILPMYGRGGTSEDRDRFKRRANQEAQAWHEAWAREALRVLKPGGYLIAAGGSRTYHRLTCGIEDAGFEVRDCLTWLFGSGFPKSLNVSEALRKLPACACDVRDEVGAVGAIGPAGTVGTRAGTEPCAMSPASGATDRAGRVGAEVPPGPTSAVANVQGSVEDGVGQDAPVVLGAGAMTGTAAGDKVVERVGCVEVAPEALRDQMVRDGGPVAAVDAWPAGDDGGADGVPPRALVLPLTAAPGGVALSGETATVGDGHAIPAAVDRNPLAVADEGGAALGADEGSHDLKCDVCGGVRRDTIRDGLGTALKPAAEFMVLARKPLAGTVAGNVLEHGTGALNINGCRIEHAGRRSPNAADGTVHRPSGVVEGGWKDSSAFDTTRGRWPANVILDEQAAVLLDDQTGDVGGASRFLYVAKASSAERNAGLDGMPEVVTHDGRAVSIDNPYLRGETGRRNPHPTVKPIDLMRWLVRLITPPGGTVLDPFTGSGTTGCAAMLEGFQFAGIERDPEYAAIARARVAWWSRRPGADTQAALAAVRAEDDRAHNGQLGLL